MKKHIMPEIKEGGVNVTPLIDVVMVLIVFFMLVAKIGIHTDEDKNIQLSQALIGINADQLGHTVTLNVQSPGSGAIGLPIVTIELPGPNGKPELREIKLHSDSGPGAPNPLRTELMLKASKDPTFSVTIRNDKDLTYRQIIPVLQEVIASGCSKMNFAGKEH